MKLKKICLSLLMATLLLFGINNVYSSKVEASQSGFTIEAVPNKYQTNKSLTYFDVMLGANKTSTLQVKVTNQTNKVITLLAQPNTGYTSDSGTESYDKSNLNAKESSASYQLQTLFGGNQQVTVPAKASKIVSFNLKMPAQAFDGVMEGAFYFLRTDTNQSSSKSKGLTINNRFAMALGVVVRSTGIADKADFKLGKIDVGRISADKFSPAVKVNIINPAKTWTRGMKITSQVTKDGKVLYETNKTEAGMAPQSNFNYAITTNHQALQSGTFHLKMVIELEGKKWVFDKDFTITKERAEAVNKDSVIEKNYTWIWILVGVLLILLLLYGIYRWGKRQGSKQQTSN